MRQLWHIETYKAFPLGHEYIVRTAKGERVGAGWTAGNRTDTIRMAKANVRDAAIRGLMALGGRAA